MITLEVYVDWISMFMRSEIFQLYERYCADIIEQVIDMEDEFVIFPNNSTHSSTRIDIGHLGSHDPLAAMKVAGNTALPDLNTPWDAMKMNLIH